MITEAIKEGGIVWLVRIGAYLLSGITVWQFLQGGGDVTSLLPERHLLLDQAHGMLFGVCAGLSAYTGIDVTVLRFVWVLVSLYKGLGIALYLLAFFLMPLA